MNKKILGLLLMSAVMSAGAATYDITEQNEGILFDYRDFGPRVQAAPNEAVDLINQAEQDFKAGKLEEAEKKLLQCQQLARGQIKQETAIIQLLGQVYARQSRAEKLLPIAQDMVNRYPENTIAQSTLAGVLVVNQQKDKAEKILKTIIAKDANDISHRLFLAGVLAQTKGRENEVLDLLNQVLQIQPNHPRTLILKTNWYIQQKQPQSALQVIQQLEKAYPGKAISEKLKGDVKLSERDIAGAIGFYKKAYQIEPNDKMLFMIADLIKTQDQGQEAIALLNAELNKKPDNLSIQFKLATIYDQQKDYPKAEKNYLAILNKQNNNAVILNNLAWNYHQQNKPQALEYAKKAYQAAPDSPAIIDTYGMILVDQGDKKKGLELIQKAAKAAPGALDIQYHLAYAYHQNQQAQEALNILQKILPSDQYFSEKKQAENLLKTLQND